METQTFTPKIHKKAVISHELAGNRLDSALKSLFPEYSRARLKTWLESGEIRVDGEVKRPRALVRGGEKVEVNATSMIETETWEAEALPETLSLEIVHQDEHLIVINKPADFVVHPGAGNAKGTVVNALLHQFPELAYLPRAGIVHRLDKDTTGLMVIARTLEAHAELVRQLETRTVSRSYAALIWGTPIAGTTINAPIGRHPKDRQRMTVIEKGKPAVTHYRVKEKFKWNTLLDVQLETGRTHQIRVHLSHVLLPIVGDKTYGKRVKVPPKMDLALASALCLFGRQALHAKRLALIHPATKEKVSWEVPLPEDLERLLGLLRATNIQHA